MDRRSSGLAAEGRLARQGRLGSLHPFGCHEARRAASQVIRARAARRVNDEDGEARITCSSALADSAVDVIIFLYEFQAPGRVIVRSELDFECSRALRRTDDSTR
jgi:hypothetical protein